PVPCKSHLGVFNTLTTELARKGHELVVISPFPPPNFPTNYTNIDIMPTIQEYYIENMELDLYQYTHPLHFPLFYWTRSLKLIRLIFSDPEVLALLHDQRGFDLVICEDLVTESLCSFADYFKAPRVMMSSIGGYHMVNYAVGNPLEPSFVPNVVLPYSHHMTFTQRLKNVLFTAFWDLGNELFFLPQQEKIRQQIFGDNTSTVWEQRDTASLVLLNNHFSLNYPRPLLPSVIEVGGFHVKRKNDPLPTDIQSFLDGATEGVIYFSMGSNLRSSAMSETKMKSITSALAELPQRVLMKWESDSLPNQPANVKLGKWLPQQDILAHPNVKVFITHGGLMSAQEAAYHGVPVVGIPVFGDQELNMRKAEIGGFGIMILLNNVSKTSITWAVKKAMNDPKIREEADRRSAVFRDQPETPLDRAIFWVEYVIRHRGAPHLRSASVDLAWYQRQLLDVAAAIIVAAIAFVFSIREFIHFCRGPSDHITAKKVQ
ncbi:UDP-glycosyltransferase-06, partial [Ephemera danica]